MPRLCVIAVLFGLSAVGVRTGRAAEPVFEPADLAFFESKIRPILVARCHECHSVKSGKKKGGLRLDERAAILTGGDTGPAAIPGKTETSLLLDAIGYGPDSLQMPPAGKLPASEIALLTEWVRRGLPFPASTLSAQRAEGIDFEQGRRHWAFQPLMEQALPATGTPAGGNRIDAFLEASRLNQGLRASPRADARTLARRVSFDLLGLPPSMDEVETLARSATDVDAYRKFVDRALASPQYGERWARHWLDLTRYADVLESWREGEGQPWRYRDWVVSALNADLPYREFVRKQLAADLLPDASPSDNAALGLLGLSPSYWKELKLDHQVIKQVVADEWEERLDTLGATFLGLAIGCARCHDHKFDPISTHDYYALAGVLASIRESDRPLIADAEAGPALKARTEVKAIEAKLKTLRAKKEPTPVERDEIAHAEARIAVLKQTAHYELPLAPGLAEASLHVLPSGKNATRLDYRPGKAQNVALQVRGNPARTGDVVPRRFLTVLTREPGKAFSQGSGRLDLANALVDEAGPLAARVIVNRVWRHHFGRGLVATPSNFGKQGALPTHPVLLEDLAARFVSEGWSLKWLHREILHSAAYQQASFRDAERERIDPENQWLWRMSPRRLDVEAWRDAVLLATGKLDLAVGGPPGDLGQTTFLRRTLYGLVKRRELHELLRLHDFPDPVTHSPQREPTTTPLQQLYVLNGPFFHQKTTDLATRAQREAPGERAARITWLYRQLYQRSPRPAELEAGQRFLARETSSAPAVTDKTAAEIPAETWRQYVHVLLASNEFLFID